MPQPNQLYERREDVNVTAADLLSMKGLSNKITEKGLRLNLNVRVCLCDPCNPQLPVIHMP